MDTINSFATCLWEPMNLISSPTEHIYIFTYSFAAYGVLTISRNIHEFYSTLTINDYIHRKIQITKIKLIRIMDIIRITFFRIVDVIRNKEIAENNPNLPNINQNLPNVNPNLPENNQDNNIIIIDDSDDEGEFIGVEDHADDEEENINQYDLDDDFIDNNDNHQEYMHEGDEDYTTGESEAYSSDR